MLPFVETEAELRSLIGRIDVSSSGSVTLLFSGPVGTLADVGGPDLQSVQVVRSLMAAGEDIRVVNRSEVAKFLDVSANSLNQNEELIILLAKLFGDRPTDKTGKSAAFLYGEVVDGVRQPNGVWDAVSARFVDETVGEIRTITGGASAGRSFAQTEVPQILRSTTITSVDGIPIEQLRSLTPDQAFKAISAQSEVLSAELKVAVDSVGKPILTNGFFDVDARAFFSSTSDFVAHQPAEHLTMRAVADFIPSERILGHQEGLQQLRILQTNLSHDLEALSLPEQQLQRLPISQSLERIGLAANIIDLSLVALQAKAAYEKGDTESAKMILLKWTSSAACAYVAGQLTSLALAPLAAAGPVGVILVTLLSLSASVAASQYGDELAHWIDSSLRTWSDPILDHFREITFQPPGSPLILDLDGDGVESSSREAEHIYFDHNGDGLAERTAWVGSDDGLLVLDLDRDGQITSGSELFGNNSFLKDSVTAANGFDALARYDASQDGILSDADDIWQHLRVWIDSDRDGVSTPAELKVLSDLGVAAIDLSYETGLTYDPQGNQHRQVGHYITTSGEERAVTDVWFALDTVRTRLVNSRVVDSEVAALPELDCIGSIPSLHQALISDQTGSLLYLTKAWMHGSMAERERILDHLIYAWAEIKIADSEVSLLPEGSFVDSRQLALFYQATGRRELEDMGVNGTLLPSQISDFYHQFREEVAWQLYFQVDIIPMLQKLHLSWDQQRQAQRLDADGLVAWVEQQVVSGTSLQHIGLLGRYLAMRWPAFLHQSFVDAIVDSGMRQNLAIRDTMLTLAVASRSNGSDNDDLIHGVYLPELLAGGAGGDQITGGAGDDIIVGGRGNDTLVGGIGDDRFIYDRGDGSDLIGCEYDVRSNKENILLMGQGVLPSDVRVSTQRDGNDLVLLISEANDQVVIQEFIADDQDSIDKAEVQRISFVNGVVWTEADVRLMLPSASMGNDVLRGTIKGDLIQAGDGCDFVYGGDGDDTLEGGRGQDVLDGGAGSDVFVFERGWGQDRISNHDSSLVSQDVIAFGAGILATDIDVTREGLDLVLRRKGSSDRVAAIGFFEGDGYGASSWDNVVFSDGTSWDVAGLRQLVLTPRPIAQSLIGYRSSDVIHAGAGNDYLMGMDGDDYLYGEAGNDLLAGNEGADTLSGGNGNDEYFYQFGDGRDVILSDYDTRADKFNKLRFGYSLRSVDLGLARVGRDLSIAVKGSYEAEGQILVADFFRGGDPTNLFNPIQEFRFDDGSKWGLQAIVDHVMNVVLGSSANDCLVGLGGDDYISGLAGDDMLYASEGSDCVEGGNGVDTLSYERFFNGANVDLSVQGPQDTGEAGVDVIVEVENVIGSLGDDRLCGDSRANIIDGGLGDDWIDGGLGNDTLIGGGQGGQGDTVSYAKAKSGVRVGLELVDPQKTGGGGIDELAGFENLVGSAYSDRLTGDSLANHIDGGAGDDWLTGSGGADCLTGGAGNDRFRYVAVEDSGLALGSRDVIADFELGDCLDVSAIDANDIAVGNQRFAFVGASAFSAIGQLRYDVVNGVGILQGNCSGDLGVDFEVAMLGEPSLRASSFLL